MFRVMCGNFRNDFLRLLRILPVGSSHSWWVDRQVSRCDEWTVKIASGWAAIVRRHNLDSRPSIKTRLQKRAMSQFVNSSSTYMYTYKTTSGTAWATKMRHEGRLQRTEQHYEYVKWYVCLRICVSGKGRYATVFTCSQKKHHEIWNRQT